MRRTEANADADVIESLGDLKAENLLLDSEGNLKVAGKNETRLLSRRSTDIFASKRFRLCQQFSTERKVTNILWFTAVSHFLLCFFIMQMTITCRYAAPELFQNQPYSPEKVDVWVREEARVLIEKKIIRRVCSVVRRSSLHLRLWTSTIRQQ